MCFILIRIKSVGTVLAAATSNQQPKFYQLPFKRKKIPHYHLTKKKPLYSVLDAIGESDSLSLSFQSRIPMREVFSHAVSEREIESVRAGDKLYIYFLIWQNVILHPRIGSGNLTRCCQMGMLRNVQNGSKNKKKSN